jgi:hypothetical protein
MDASDRFRLALGRLAHFELLAEGVVFLSVSDIENVAAQVEIEDHLASLALEEFENRGDLTRQGTIWKGERLALRYELEHDRPAFRAGNVNRRLLLLAAAAAREQGGLDLRYEEGKEEIGGLRWSEAAVAALSLELFGLVEYQPMMGHAFYVRITPDGYGLSADERALDAQLPTTATADTAAHTSVSADALDEIITSCQNILQQRGWQSARSELERGDLQYRDGHWADAVGEYYSALESGLKYRLDELDTAYGRTTTLPTLASLVAQAGAIPVNYQQMFTFINSIRSPRRHGAGARVEVVEIGPAEALLMGNHVRTLLLYLGHRPPQ